MKTDRFCQFCQYYISIEYRVLNESTVKDAFPIPNIEDLVNNLNLMIIELLSIWPKVLVLVLVKVLKRTSLSIQENKPKTAFMTDWGLYECNVISFVLSNAPETFQRLMTMKLGSEIGKSCFVHLDDILIYSSTREQHYKDVYVFVCRQSNEDSSGRSAE